MSWPELALALVAQVFAAGAIYGGIRADLRAMHARVTLAQERAEGAHDRIDNILLKGD